MQKVNEAYRNQSESSNIQFQKRLNFMKKKYKKVFGDSIIQQAYFLSGIQLQNKQKFFEKNNKSGFQSVQLMGKIQRFGDSVTQIKLPAIEEDYQSPIFSQKVFPPQLSCSNIPIQTQIFSDTKLSPFKSGGGSKRKNNSQFFQQSFQRSAQSTLYFEDDEPLQSLQSQPSVSIINRQKSNTNFYGLAQRKFVSLHMPEDFSNKINKAQFMKRRVSDYIKPKLSKGKESKITQSPLHYIEKQVIRLKVNY